MAKPQERFVCQSCGAVYHRWQGRCDACAAWNTLGEEARPQGIPRGLSPGKGRLVAFTNLAEAGQPMARQQTGIAELDRVFGGGLVPGSAVLVGGDPGIGKSTLVLQALAALARRGAACVYVAGEEAPGQIAMRAKRLGLGDAPVAVAAATDLRDVLAGLESRAGAAPGGLVAAVDSIQTIYADNLDSAPGTIAQLRAGVQELVRFAKRRHASVLMIGHVTKEGQLAGPRVVEHMVDTVLYFEGERGHQFRVLRAVKNRFGATDEIGVFVMTDRGLEEVANPSALFIGQRRRPVSGASVFAGIEGTRPLLMEIQALVTTSPLATPRRAAVGCDAGRLAMILAVLEARCGLRFSGSDIYVNVAGGLRVQEPAADIAIAGALISSLTDRPLPENSVLFGEISLAGEVRPVASAEARLKEAAKLGFDQAFVPAGSAVSAAGLRLHELAELADMLDLHPAGRGSPRE